MEIKLSHSIISAIVTCSILFGTVLPSGLHIKSMKMCDMSMHTNEMQTMDKKEGHCDMMMSSKSVEKHSQQQTNDDAISCESMFACACDISAPPLEVQSPVHTTIQIPDIQLQFSYTLIPVSPELSDFSHSSIVLSDSYRPPPLFLANESFLI